MIPVQINLPAALRQGKNTPGVQPPHARCDRRSALTRNWRWRSSVVQAAGRMLRRAGRPAGCDWLMAQVPVATPGRAACCGCRTVQDDPANEQVSDACADRYAGNAWVEIPASQGRDAAIRRFGPLHAPARSGPNPGPGTVPTRPAPPCFVLVPDAPVFTIQRSPFARGGYWSVTKLARASSLVFDLRNPSRFGAEIAGAVDRSTLEQVRALPCPPCGHPPAQTSWSGRSCGRGYKRQIFGLVRDNDAALHDVKHRMI